MGDTLAEWSFLGRRLQLLCPDKYDELLEALRETVGFHEILAPSVRPLALDESRFFVPKA
jgi:hypothetical protein